MLFECTQLAVGEENQVQEVTRFSKYFPWRLSSRYFVMQSDVFDSAGNKVIILAEGQTLFCRVQQF